MIHLYCDITLCAEIWYCEIVKLLYFYLHFFFGGELTTCKQWNPVFFNLKLSIGVVLETFQMRKTPTWESNQVIRNANVNIFVW